MPHPLRVVLCRQHVIIAGGTYGLQSLSVHVVLVSSANPDGKPGKLVNFGNSKEKCEIFKNCS